MLKIANSNHTENINSSFEQKKSDHYYLLDQYILSHHTRNHSILTIQKEKNFLHSWFKNYSVLFAWEAMRPLHGRERILEYASTLMAAQISHKTMRSYIGILSRLFTFILDHPFIKRGHEFIRLELLYGPITQPISEYDIPKHSYDGEQLGVPMDPDDLLVFYQSLRKNYLLSEDSISAAIRARYYAMAVTAGLCGFRIDELLHLDIKQDLFFKSCKIQTRFAKGTSGSGKRSRITLFPSLARDTLKFYINHYRPKLFVGKSDILFPNCNGKILTFSSANNALNEMITVAQKNNFHVASHMSWHWFRRIFSTRFIEQNPHQLSILIQLLGHTSPNTVHKYIRHSEAWMDKKILQALQGDLL